MHAVSDEWEVGEFAAAMIGRHARGGAMAAEIDIDDQSPLSPWIDDLIRRYRDSERRHRIRPVSTAILVLLIAGATGLPWLLRLDHAAYPDEPRKQQALELCSRTDPTFIRFLASERATCYEQFPNLQQ